MYGFEKEVSLSKVSTLTRLNIIDKKW